MNYKQSEKILNEIEQWYVDVIRRVAFDHGGYERLSLKLNKSAPYISALLKSNKSLKNLRQGVTLLVEYKLWPEE